MPENLAVAAVSRKRAELAGEILARSSTAMARGTLGWVIDKPVDIGFFAGNYADRRLAQGAAGAACAPWLTKARPMGHCSGSDIS